MSLVSFGHFIDLFVAICIGCRCFSSARNQWNNYVSRSSVPPASPQQTGTTRGGLVHTPPCPLTTRLSDAPALDQ